MKYVKTENPKHYRINLERTLFYYPYEYNGSFYIKFKVAGTDVQWTFKNSEERDSILLQLDYASASQNIQTIVSL